MGQSSGRRWFLKSVTALGGAASLPAPASAAEPHAQHAARAPSQTYMYLTQPEVAFVEAAVARLIPADELGPGAKEAGVACFIDRKLVGAPGVAAVYTAHVDRHGVPYNAVPVSIQDIVDNLAQVDEHGHPKHILLTRKD